MTIAAADEYSPESGQTLPGFSLVGDEKGKRGAWRKDREVGILVLLASTPHSGRLFRTKRLQDGTLTPLLLAAIFDRRNF
jgi:hypothetical protein